jgi:hypothetical protein
VKKVSQVRGWPPQWSGPGGHDNINPPGDRVVLVGVTTRRTAAVLVAKFEGRDLTAVLILTTRDDARDVAAALQEGIGSTIDQAGELPLG